MSSVTMGCSLDAWRASSLRVLSNSNRRHRTRRDSCKAGPLDCGLLHGCLGGAPRQICCGAPVDRARRTQRGWRIPLRGVCRTFVLLIAAKGLCGLFRLANTPDTNRSAGQHFGAALWSSSFLGWRYDSYLVDSASSHMLVSKIKPCMSKYKQLYSETANGSLNQLSFI